MATSDVLNASLRTRWQAGDGWVWLTATAVSIALLAVLGVVLLLAWQGLAHFWPADIVKLLVVDGSERQVVIGEVAGRETLSPQQFLEASGDRGNPALPAEIERWLIKQGNRRLAPPDFRWVNRHEVLELSRPQSLWVFERMEWGNAYGRMIALSHRGEVISDPQQLKRQFAPALRQATQAREALQSIETGELAALSEATAEVNAKLTGLASSDAPPNPSLLADREALQVRYRALSAELAKRRAQLATEFVELETAAGRTLRIPLTEVVRAWQPNQMTMLQKLRHFGDSLLRFVTHEPREANTEGGIYPAIFGTVLMVLLMALLVTPFGVIAAIYLHEYAKQGPFVQLIRVSVNNLAGVPSIVYGVFGLGFFVYFLGGNIDQLFFSDSLPAPTFGTPGLLWASLTLALLTVPVVIVATEEGLSRIPRSVREGSFALGATRAETLFRLVLPIASPSIITGVILAVARAAGEVAPLMLVGVVKLAPALPVDAQFPFLHLDRKFMHLGFHIYDVGFQSPNVEAARPLVFATALLLVLIVLVLNLVAIVLRSRLEMRYRGVNE